MIRQLVFYPAYRGSSEQIRLEGPDLPANGLTTPTSIFDRRGSNQAISDGNGRAVSWKLY